MRRNLKKKTKEKKKGRDITRGIDQNEIIESEPTAIDFYARLKSSNAPCSFILCILFLFFFLFCFSSLPMPRVHAKHSRGIYDSFTRNNSHISRHIYIYTHTVHTHIHANIRIRIHTIHYYPHSTMYINAYETCVRGIESPNYPKKNVHKREQNKIFDIDRYPL